jgi:hypothetical protein
VAWRLRFDNSGEGYLLADAIASAPGIAFERLQLTPFVEEREILILAASDPAVLVSWTNFEDCGRVEDLPVPPQQTETPSALARRVLPGRF